MAAASKRRDGISGILRTAALVLAATPLLLVGPASAGVAAARELTIEDVRAPLVLRDGWRWRAGDDPAWASPELDDREWTAIAATDELREPAAVSWFRRELEVGESLWARDLGWYLDLRGSAQVYLDGELLYNFGSLPAPPGYTERRLVPRQGTAPRRSLASPPPGGPLEFGPRYRNFSFPPAPRQLLAIRYDRRSHTGFDWWTPAAGFRLVVGEPAPMIAYARRLGHRVAGHQMFFVGAFGGQAVLHFLMFSFTRRFRSNLFFGLITACAAALAALHFERPLAEDPQVLAFSNLVADPLLIVAMLLLLRFSYLIFDHPLGRWFWTVVAVGMGIAVLVAVDQDFEAFSHFWWFLMIVVGETLRMHVKTVRSGRPIAWFLIGGTLGLLVGLGWQMLLDAGFLDPPLPFFPVSYYGVAALLLSVSLFIAFVFARLGRNLELQLQQVEELSKRTLEQELQAKEREIERRLLEADNRRKTEELDAARELQLSLLPAELPRMEGLRVAAAMTTATEVGGDYYDFRVDGGVLTAALGDATGHGARAGAMVSLMKGMFSTFGAAEDIPRFFRGASATVRAMRIDGMNLSLALARFRDGSLTYAAAGMPPALVYRAADRRVEEILVEGMPLGGLADFRYTARSASLSAGDVVLLMSDGFPEMAGADGAPLGYERPRELLARWGNLDPEEIVALFQRAAREWSADAPFPDDVTFVVVKVAEHDG
ncbi:MAG TPA: PP2C family protein-serine/threonine phosphatase [Thermoanaerobaculia bacterium]|nr:PP2C family protein-serine/threonine phosphatase [Thermoanaerobaculia bacterium]